MIQIGAPAATIDSPVEHLMACHRRIEQRLDTLIRAAGSLITDRDLALAAIHKSLEFLDSNGAMHTEDEERSLFPRLRTKLSSNQIAYLDSLEQQHAEADAILVRLKQLTRDAANGYPVPQELADRFRDCAESLRSFYGRHIQSEDEILTEMAKASLTESELAGIAREMRERRTRGAAVTDSLATA